jgi:hypothetical protein
MRITACEISKTDKRILEQAIEEGVVYCTSITYCWEKMDCRACVLKGKECLYEDDAKEILSIAKVVK